MTATLGEDILSQLSVVVSERIGLSFPKERWTELERGIRTAARELGFDTAESALRWFLSGRPDRRHTETLASHLTVGETYFFRDTRTFQALREQILPSLISSRSEHKRLRFWSAGCCTGEEPYSLAILLHSLLPDFEQWNITILATDINPKFLRKAATGVYGDWSFRETPSWIKERYFIRTRDGQLEIMPDIRSAVTFVPLNLVDDSYPSFLTNTNAMDLVLCRNVLMYFLQQAAKNVAKKIFQSLVSGGWLLVSPSEMSQALFPEFETVHVLEALCYRKNGVRALDNVALHQVSEIQPKTPEIEPMDLPPVIVESPSTVSGLKDSSSMERTNAPVDPAALQDLHQRALAEYERGTFDLAARHIRTLLETQPEEPFLLSLLARSMANQGNLDGAEVQCQKAIKMDKLNPVHRDLYATILHELGRDDDAIRSLKESIYLNPDVPLSHFLLASLARRRGDGNQADKHFHWALHLLARYPQQDILPESDGMTAGRLAEIIQSVIETRSGHEDKAG